MSFEIKGFQKLMDVFGGGSGTTPVGAAPVHPQRPDQVGRMIAGRFEIVREIGRGGVGLVYQAVQTSMNRPVAVKLLTPDNTGDSDARARFRQEAAAISRLKDPHTVSVFDFGEDETGELFLVMELLEGLPLSRLLRDKGPLPPSDVTVIAGQILDSLSEAHAAGILHRDLKPDNVFVLSQPGDRIFVKVLDFGLARMMDETLDRRTFPGIVFGTPAYMSPEQVLGHELDVRSDLYSVAVIMFELLTGTLPVRGKTALELGIRKTRLQPLRLEDANPNLDYSPGAHVFFQRTLALNPALRPSNTEEFRALMTKSFDRKPAGGRGGRRQLHDIYHAAPSLPEHAAPFNRDGTEILEERQQRPVQTRNVKTIPQPTVSEPTFIDEALKREKQQARTAGVIGVGPQVPGDRRKARRGSKLAGVRCMYDGEEHLATATDLSATGAFISSTWLPISGHRLTILFKYPGGRDWAVSILAEVSRVCTGPGARGEVRGFAVSWLKLRAVGDIDTVYAFLNETLGIHKDPVAPQSPNNNQWEFIFEAGGLG